MTSGATETGYAGVFQSLRETPPAVRLVLLGVFINQFGAFLQFFLVLYLAERGFSTGEAGIALGAYSVGAIFGVLFGGSLSDRLGSRWTIVSSVSAAALFTLSVTMLDSLPAIVVAVALAGAMTQAARPAVAALLFSLVPEARQVMTMAMYRTALNAGVAVGPLVAVWLSTISWDLIFYVDAASALVYAAIAAFLLPKKDSAGTAATQDSTAAGRRLSYLVILRDYRYLAYLALMLANGIVHVQAFAVLPVMLDAAGYATWAYGTAASLSAIILISCELFVTQTTQRWPAWVAVLAGWVLLVLGRGMFGLPGGLFMIYAGSVLAVVGQIIGGPAAFAYPAKVAPTGLTGRYIGSAHAMFVVGYAVGPIAGIALWNVVGNAFWGLIVLFGLVMTVAGLWGMRPAVRAAEPARSEPAATEPAPTEPAPTERAPAEPAATEPAATRAEPDPAAAKPTS